MITLFDIIILTILAIFSLIGLYQGAIGFITRVMGFILSILLTYYISPYIIEIFQKHIDNEIMVIIISGIISYIISLVVCIFIIHKFLALVSAIRKGFLDRTIGVVVGLSIGLSFTIMIFLIMAVITSNNYDKNKDLQSFIENEDHDKYAKFLQTSFSVKYLDSLCRNIVTIIPINDFKALQIFNNEKLKKSHKQKKNNQSSQDLDNELGEVFSNIEDEDK